MAESFRRTAPVLCVLLAALVACAPSPRKVIEKKKEEPQKEIILHTEAHDEKAGARAAETVAAQVGTVDDLVLASLVAQVGRRVARHAPPSEFTYRIQIVDDDSPNAFALPGGYLYVSRGLLLLANSEDELANVIAHEIVHVARRHAAARQQLVQGLPALFQVFMLGQVAAYSREQERESDALGQQLAAQAGYDPEAMSRFLRNLEFHERLLLGFSRYQGYFDSHPATAERVVTAGDLARAMQWTRQPGVLPGRDAYLRALDGLVVGIGAAEGVVERGRFLHADLGFSMGFPERWKVINTHTAVGAISPERNAQIVLEMQGRGDDAFAASREYFEKPEFERLAIRNEQALQLGGMPAHRIEGTASTPVGPLPVHITWFVNGGNVYRLTGVWLGNRSRASLFGNVARSFRPLTPRERRSIRETRLRVVPALAGERLGELSQRSGNQWNLQRTAVMNGLFADAELSEGQLVKVAVEQAYTPPDPGPEG